MVCHSKARWKFALSVTYPEKPPMTLMKEHHVQLDLGEGGSSDKRRWDVLWALKLIWAMLLISWGSFLQNITAFSGCSPLRSFRRGYLHTPNCIHLRIVVRLVGDCSSCCQRAHGRIFYCLPSQNLAIKVNKSFYDAQRVNTTILRGVRRGVCKKSQAHHIVVYRISQRTR